jgi:uncharacterized protein
LVDVKQLLKASFISNELIITIKKQFHLNWKGIHGISHWTRVCSNGMRLAEQTGAHIKVIQLFSVFHDSRRLNEGSDVLHGPRGAELAVALRGNHFDLNDEEFALLHQACSLHTTTESHENITVQTCFDADRLDLGRVGIVPDPQYLCTDIAKAAETIEWAYERSVNGVIPDEHSAVCEQIRRFALEKNRVVQKLHLP